MSLDTDLLATMRTGLHEELAPIRNQLDVIEGKLALLPDLLFLYSSPVAQTVVAALRKSEAKPRPSIEGLKVPDDPPPGSGYRPPKVDRRL